MIRDLKNEQGEIVLTIELSEDKTEQEIEKIFQGMGYNLDGTQFKPIVVELTQEDLQTQAQDLMTQLQEIMEKLK